VDPQRPFPSSVALCSSRSSIQALVTYVLDPATWPDVRSVATPAEIAAITAPAPIVLLDLDADEVVRIQDIRTVRPDARIVALAADATGGAVLDALRAGVRAYVRTPEEVVTLDDVLARVARGDVVIRLELQRAAVEELGRLVRRVREGADVSGRLTPREREILGLLADGLTARQIGTRLSISPRTVEGHATGLYRKLDVRSRVQAVARAAAIGLIGVR
jgi:DNA-binding NarL/FixJ family response regulator